MEKYKWLIVLRNGKEYWIKHEADNIKTLLNELVPKNPAGEIKWTALELVHPGIDDNDTVCIKSTEISNILFHA